jgi:hypothetical protein
MDSDNSHENSGNQPDKSVTPWGRRILGGLDRLNRRPAWLADAAKLDPNTLSGNIYKTMPRADAAVRIAKALGMSVEYLMTGETIPPGSAVAGAQQVLRDHGARAFDPVHRPRPIPGKGEPTAYDRAAITFDEATRIAQWEPPEAVRVAMMQILFRHDIDAESVALLLEAVAPEEDLF